ncbi:hypothetical protein AMECASPLE_027405 [Ameca splendens]|uniref:Uncharacterized protein n=1 Tax=Ameca splendens TaxID=208324 RepID=A0ABV0XU42_9TELE
MYFEIKTYFTQDPTTKEMLTDVQEQMGLPVPGDSTAPMKQQMQRRVSLLNVLPFHGSSASSLASSSKASQPVTQDDHLCLVYRPWVFM